MKYFTGVGTQVGQRISILSEVLSTREEPPRIWYSQSFPTTPRLNEQLQINVLEVQEHLETYFDRKENVMEVMPNASRIARPSFARCNICLLCPVYPIQVLGSREGNHKAHAIQ